MKNPLRVFISSTMDDLQNERQAVAKKLLSLGYQPVNAEAMSPTGSNSWDTIDDEMRECHLFVLILGEKYGWIPTDGYGAGSEKSVTHLEYSRARQLGIPVLSFMKRLKLGTKSDTGRDAFRSEVSDWAGGLFRAEFDWAEDLSDKVYDAFVDLSMNIQRKELLRRRDQAVANISTPPSTQPSPVTTLSVQPSSPVQNFSKTRAGEWALIAGAGLSISAGFPTARLIVGGLVKRLWPTIEGDEVLARYTFDQVAGYFEAKFGREALSQAIGDMLDTPQRVSPSDAHVQAVKKFRVILTTNYDELFEQACEWSSIPYVVSTPTKPQAHEAGKLTLFKLSGTLSDLASLRITASDLIGVTKSNYHRDVCSSLSGRSVAVVGHSLRDSHVVSVLEDSNRSGSGVYVRPFAEPMDDILLEKFRLTSVCKTADEYLSDF